MLVYVFDAFLMRERLHKLLEPMGHKVQGSDDLEEAVLETVSLQPQLLVIGDAASSAGMNESIQMLKKAGGGVPVVVLSPDARRSTLTAAAIAGASDYIVMPLDDSALSQRLLRLEPKTKSETDKKEAEMAEAMDFQRELDHFFREGTPPPEGLGLLMTVLFRPGGHVDHLVELEYQQNGGMFYQGIQGQVVRRQADKFFRYGNQAFLAVLPGATKKGCEIITLRLEELLKDFQTKGKLPPNYRLATATVFVPEDGSKREELLRHLTDRIRWAIAWTIRPSST